MFKGNERVINIADTISTNYHLVGTALLQDEDGTILDSIVEQYSKNFSKINYAILKKWIQTSRRQECSWKKLIEVLDKCNCVSLAEEMKEALGIM